MTSPSAAKLGGFDEAAFERFLATRDEPDWVTDLRRQAFEMYTQKSAEELDPEEWKRVDIRAFDSSKFEIQTEQQTGGDAAAQFDTLMHDRATYAGDVAHVDGRSTTRPIDKTWSEKGVLFGDLTELVREHREILEPYLMTKAVSPDTDRFAALHAAFWTGGTVLYVPRNVELSEPLHSLIGLSSAGAAELSHTLIILEEGASATLLEETASATEDAPGLHIGAVELIVGSGANLRYVQLQNWNQKTWHFAHQGGLVDRDGALQWTVAALGSKLAHVHQDVVLKGTGASAEVNGVTFATNRQTLSYYTKQAHEAPHTRSDLLYKDVLRDRSRVIWRGMIRVEKEAQLTDGYQRNDSLVLTPTCRVDAIPGLEIEADDVRCTHGATAGRVDEEQIFYSMCRGMTEHEAMHMIVEGFFHGVYDRIPMEMVRETLSQAVEKKLGIGRL